jgi:RNA polymerase sigma-70 factor (ECF subfamily)
MPSEESDRALVERVKRGDRSAFEALHRRYYPKIYRLAYLKTGNADDAQDIASDTFCRALVNLPQYQFRRCDSLYPWLHRIAYNLVVDLSRARPPGGVVSLDAAASEELTAYLEQLPETGPSPQELAERKELAALVRHAIQQLPNDQCDAVCYRFLADLSIKEIAYALNRSEGAVKSLLHRALVSLRREMMGKLAEMGVAARSASARAVETTDTDLNHVNRLQRADRG